MISSGNDMRVLFVVYSTADEHNGIMSISSVLKNRGHQVDLVEARYKKISKKLKYNKIPVILAYSTPTLLADYYLNLNRKIKKDFKAFSVFGGPHPTACPEIIEEEGVDCVCIGEGEYAMLELVQNLSFSKPVANIRNLWVKENGNVFKNPLRLLISDLDILPFVDRELFRNQRFFDPEKMHVLAGRGCPYSCSYCCHSYYNRIYKGGVSKTRKRGVKNVIEEIRLFKSRFPLKFVIFEDDIFVLPVEWLEEFTFQYKKDVGVPFFCYLRPNTVNHKVVGLLKSAGCHSVSMGIETAEDNLRNAILKRNMTKEQIIGAARLIKEYKIRLKVSNIIGIPGTFLDADLETIKLNIECKVDYSSVESLKLYPKTEISTLFKKSELSYLRKNLRYLFALVVEYPFLLKVIKILIRLPLSLVYKLCYMFWEGYCAYSRLYPAGTRAFMRGIRKYISTSSFKCS
jgi:anaerobic magnesium-protoporphyrin IX monomethyl ester cyclase